MNREVKTADIKYAFERAFSKEVPSGYAGAYFSSIVGTPAKPNTRRHQADLGHRDARRHHDRLQAQDAERAARLAGAVMPITMPVPEEYAKKCDASTPSKYDQYVAFTGPYMVKNDPKTGKLTGRVPGKSIDIVRNPNWDKSTDYRPAYLDEINIEEGNDDLATASRRR